MSVLTEQAELAPRTLFARVLVGIDSSEESREAARQGAAVAEGQGSVFERVAHQARSSVLIVREHMAAPRRGAGL